MLFSFFATRVIRSCAVIAKPEKEKNGKAPELEASSWRRRRRLRGKRNCHSVGRAITILLWFASAILQPRSNAVENVDCFLQGRSESPSEAVERTIPATHADRQRLQLCHRRRYAMRLTTPFLRRPLLRLLLTKAVRPRRARVFLYLHQISRILYMLRIATWPTTVSEYFLRSFESRERCSLLL